MSVTKPILYSYFRSSCSWRVRIALNLKGIDYEIVPVNLLEGEQKEDEYSALNPSHLVPALVVQHGDKQSVISESLAILEYIEEVYPDIKPRFLPDQPLDRALVRSIVATIACDIQPLQSQRVQKSLPEDIRAELVNRFITLGFEGLEKMLEKSAGKYCVGDTLTMADCCLVPQVDNARRYNVDMTQLPTISRIDATLCELEPFKRAHPKEQPDFV